MHSVPHGTKSAAGADMAAGGTERAAILADQRLVPTLRTLLAGQGLALAGGLTFCSGHIEYAHAREWIAILGKDAEHRVAVNHQLRHIRDGGGPRLRLLRPRDTGQERAIALGVTQELA